MTGASISDVRDRRRSEILREITALLPLDMKPDMRVVLFGSFATGDWDARSDIDIAVIVPDETMRASGVRVANALLGQMPGGRSLDLVVLTEPELVCSGLRSVIEQGQVLRGAPFDVSGGRCRSDSRPLSRGGS